MVDSFGSSTVTNRLCRLTLNRPAKLNALTVAVFQEIAGPLDAVAAHGSHVRPLDPTPLAGSFGFAKRAERSWHR